MATETFEFRDRSQKVRKSQEEVINNTKQQTEELKKQAAEARKLEQAATRMLKSIETPQEKYNRRLKEANEALKAVNASEEKRGRVIRKLDMELEKANRSQLQMFGDQALSRMRGFISVAGSAAIATRFLGDALRFSAEQNERALQSSLRLQKQNERLGTVARSTGQAIARERRADELAARFGVPRDVTRELLFAGISEDFEESVAAIARADVSIPVDAGAQIVGQVRGLFPFQDITPQQALASVFRAGERARVTPAQIGRVLPRAAEGAALQRATLQETNALLAVLTSQFGTEQIAATNIGTFGARLSLDPRTRGRGILGGVDVLQGLSASERQAFLGESKELNVAFSKITENRSSIDAALRNQQQAFARAGTAQSLLSQNIANQLANPSVAGPRAVRAAEIRTEVALERQRGEGAARRRAARLESQAALIEGGQGSLGQFVSGGFGATAEFVGAPEAVTGAAPTVGSFSTLGLLDRIIQFAAGTNQRMADGIDELVSQGSDRPNVKRTARP